MSELIITKPGGVHVATEEVFVLIDALLELGRDVGIAAGFLAHPGSSYRPDGYDQLRAALTHIHDDVDELSRALVDYTERVAWQEAWRSRLWEATREQWWSVIVALGTGSATRPGNRPEGAVDDAAASLLATQGHYRPTVDVTQVESYQGEDRAGGIAARIARIPEGSQPIRIERYRTLEGMWHTEVFIAGTRTWGLDERSDPFDMRSNLALVAGVPAAATIATEKAMRRAGVRPGERVVFVGHSQGGAVANTLAESGRYNTQGLITVGAPVGNQPVHGSYPAVRIEHQDDLVVELGGHTQPGQSIIVEAHSGADPGDIAQAHSRERYLETAVQVDQSELPELSQWDASLPTVRPGEVRIFDAREVSVRGEAVDGKTAR